MGRVLGTQFFFTLGGELVDLGGFKKKRGF